MSNPSADGLKGREKASCEAEFHEEASRIFRKYD